MGRLFKGVMLTGTMLLGACGGAELPLEEEAQLESVEQGIEPLDCAVKPDQWVAYYSNSTRTVEVGRRDCLCDGTELYYGTRTVWYRSFYYNVCG